MATEKGEIFADLKYAVQTGDDAKQREAEDELEKRGVSPTLITTYIAAVFVATFGVSRVIF